MRVKDGTVAADAAVARGLRLAKLSGQTREWLAQALPAADRLGNPIDLGIRASLGDQREAVSALLADEAVDAVLVVHIGLSGGPDDDPARRLASLEEAVEGAAKPVVACVVGPNGELPERDERAVPNYRFPEAAVRALAIAADRRDWLGRRRGQAPKLEGFDATAARAAAAGAGVGWLGEEAARALLASAGIGVGSPDGSRRRSAGSVDVLVGAVNDPELGPVVGVGTGGGRPLVPGDVAFRLAPMTDLDAEELVAAPAALRAALATTPHEATALRDLVLRVAALADAVPELAELELDPVRVHEGGAAVGGRRMRLDVAPERVSPKTW